MKGKQLTKNGKIALISVAGVVLILAALLAMFVFGKGKKGTDGGLASIFDISKGTTVFNRPNIIYILVDDMGYGDISAFGSKLISTPNIDKLAQNGMRLNNYFAPSPVCTPSRAACLTGRYAIRSVPDVLYPTSGSFPNEVPGMPAEEILIPELLRDNGYATGMLGKWHLGDTEGYLPNDNGFDFFYGALYSNDMEPYAFYRNKEVELEAPVDQTVITKNLTTEALGFITENKDEPFFLYYAQPFPHCPNYASEEFRGSSAAGVYGDSVQELDWSVGQIVAKLEELKIDDNTLIVFTSDNGPWYEGSTGGQQGRKGQVWGGGQKVPFIACWPGTIPKGKTVDAMSMGIDMLPTIMDITDIPLPDDRVIDGKSMLPIFTGETTETPHDYLYFIDGKKIMAVTDGALKYQRIGPASSSKHYMLEHGPYIYDFQKDFDESYNLIEDNKATADEFEELIQSMERALKMNPKGFN